MSIRTLSQMETLLSNSPINPDTANDIYDFCLTLESIIKRNSNNFIDAEKRNIKLVEEIAQLKEQNKIMRELIEDAELIIVNYKYSTYMDGKKELTLIAIEWQERARLTQQQRK